MEDVRFTTKGDTLYAFVMGWPDYQAFIRPLAQNTDLRVGKIQTVELLGSTAKLEWSQDQAGLKVLMPPQKPCDHAIVMKISGALLAAAREPAFRPVVASPIRRQSTYCSSTWRTHIRRGYNHHTLAEKSPTFRHAFENTFHSLPSQRYQLRRNLLLGSQTELQAQSVSPPQPSTATVDFVRDIQPIFQKSCIACHGPNTQMAGLRLDAKQAVFAKVVVPGKATESSLYQRVAGIGEVARMPMGGRLARRSDRNDQSLDRSGRRLA